MRTPALALTIGLLVGGSLTACGDDDESTAPATTAPQTAPADEEAESTGIVVEEAWVRVAREGMGAAYLTVRNDGEATVRLSGASTPSAESVEIHETTMADDGTMQMVEQPEGFEIAPGEELVLEPGGKHLMLLGFDPGDASSIELTLDFDGTTVTVDAPIDADSSAEASDMSHGEAEHGDGHGGEAAPASDDLETLLAGLDISALHGIDDDIAAGTFDPAAQRPIAQAALDHLRATEWPVDVDVAPLDAALSDLLAAFDAGDAEAAGVAAAAVHDLAHDLEPHSH
jgi:copper(I)-binding protein